VNLAILDRLDLFAATGFEAHVPDHVLNELTRPEQRERLDRAMVAGHLRVLEITDFAEISEYARLRKRFGDGESAAMAVAFLRGWAVAVDEVKAVRRQVVERLGENRLVTTPTLLVRAVHQSVIDRSTLPAIRATLEANRFRMPKLEVEEA
jgi:predicted nucleic acid-binding protein